MSPTEGTGDKLRHYTKTLLGRLNRTSLPETVRLADDTLLLLQRLHDGWGTVRSTNRRFRGRSSAPLRAVLYELEPHPHKAMKDDATGAFIRELLEDLAHDRIKRERK